MAEASAWVIIPKLDKDKTGVVLDMRPLTQCKNCKFGKIINVNGKIQVACKREGKARELDWFCADGESYLEIKLREAWLNL